MKSKKTGNFFQGGPKNFVNFLFVGLLLMGALLLLNHLTQGVTPTHVYSYSQFLKKVEENTVKNGKVKIIGNYEKVKDISKNLQKRLLENGMPLSVLESLLSKNVVEEGEEK